ncbi:InlB B-repeat-containing protein [Anaerostipes caccae]|uniref:InlB B-repeat-containing protein n=1 Tax=Anaerostipes caccae TaxID=105841 RepID=UPI0038D4CD1B
MLENPGGGISGIEELTPERRTTEETSTETEAADQMFSVREKDEEQKTSTQRKKITGFTKNLAENGQTFLDVSKGDIRITLNGATGGGLAEDETELNPKGYWITGTTTENNIEVSEGVKTDITLDNVNITIGKVDTTTSKWDCINVSHTDVTLTLVGDNELLCNTGRSGDFVVPNTGCALAKDGMDGNLVIQCESADKKGHKCGESCGSLTAKGNPALWHVGAIGSTLRNRDIVKESGFSNFTIKGGNIEALAGYHTPGIGSSCVSEVCGGGYTKNIQITGGNVKAVGTANGSGIGSGGGNTVDGVYISGGRVEAHGGSRAPGIGVSFGDSHGNLKNLKIRGGDTVIKAVGDKTTNMPGIGSAEGNEKVSNVTASPDFGFQGYIQDGTSETDYTFVEGTPFKEKTNIEVGKFYTMVYFGPFRDANEIEKDTKDQIGANHVISKTGGEGFTKEQLKGLTKVTGKDENGTDFNTSDLSFTKEEQIQAINAAKTSGKTGEFPLTFMTPNGTEITVTVYLKADGTDAAQIDPEKLEPTIGADGFQQDTGGEAFSEEDVRKLASVQGKDSEGTTHPQEDFTTDADQLETINEAKTSGKGGTFELTFTSPEGKKATVEVVLKAYDETAVNETTGEQIKGLDIISKTGGEAFTKEHLIKLSDVTAQNRDGDAITGTELKFPDENQIKEINEAKTSGKTGDFLLTIETPDGTGITIHVYLRESGTDKAENREDGKQKSSLGANDTAQPTGGKGFSEAEITELCGCKGKDIHGNNVTVRVDEAQLKQINEAKTKEKTGTFSLTFSLEDGTKAEVTVTLTGDHTVSFDPDGGDYQPKDQIVVGGRPAVEPKEPKKGGYTFEGWYYTDETGREVKWNFDTPVHQSMTLKARWKKETGKSKPKGTTAAKAGQDDENWNYREIGGDTKGSRTARTGDESRALLVFGCMAGLSGAAICLSKRKRYK